MTRVQVGDVHWNVEATGSGPPILALHGFTGSAASWESFVQAAQKDYTIVAVDVLGHGHSDSPPDPARYRMERCVQDLAALLDRLRLSQVRWLGYSMGGRIALGAAAALPQRSATLIVESASPGLPTAEERAARVREDERLADWIEQVGVPEFIRYWEALPLFATQARLPEPVRARQRAQRLSNNPLGLANSLRGIGAGAQPPLHDKLKGLSLPTLFIAGEEDARYAAIAREMHGKAPGSRLRLIAQVGHAVHLEQPDRFNQVVLEFLRAVDQGGPPQSVTSTAFGTPSH